MVYHLVKRSARRTFHRNQHQSQCCTLNKIPIFGREDRGVLNEGSFQLTVQLFVGLADENNVMLLSYFVQSKLSISDSIV